MQGHFLTAWAQAYAVLGDTTCRDKANYMVAELAKCQANNGAAGFNAGYLSGFPESDFTALEARTLSNGNVPYYCIHKTLAGLLDVWRYIGSTQARDVLLALAGWVDWRTGRLSSSQMQTMLGTEFGGMNAVLTDLYQQTGDARWLTAAQRFDHAAVFNPLASNQDQLNGLHANTQVPKWIGAAREYKATGTTRYRDIAANAWNITVNAHTLRHRRQQPGRALPGAQRDRRRTSTNDTCEHCNTYNMLKLTRELWLLDPEPGGYFDFYERALLNHLIGAQNPADGHGHITYFTPLNPGGRRGVGPAWGGGTWSTDYNSFWCCQGTGIEINTKLMDSIYFYNGTTLTVNLFMPSVLNWTQRGITVTQTTTYPVSDTTTLHGHRQRERLVVDAHPHPGLDHRRHDQRQRRRAEHHHHAGQLRHAHPLLDLRRHGHRAPADAGGHAGRQRQRQRRGGHLRPGRAVRQLRQHHAVRAAGADHLLGHPDQHHRAGVHRHRQRVDGQPRARSTTRTATTTPSTGTPTARAAAAAGRAYRLVNAASGLVLGIQNMSTADGGLALQWADNGTADHNWELIVDGTAVRLRNVNSGKVLGVENMSTADNARVLQWADNGTADHRWTRRRRRRRHAQASATCTAASCSPSCNGSTARARRPSRTPTTAAPDNQWRVRSQRRPPHPEPRPAAWCSACRTCPPPTAGSSSSGATPAPPTTCGPRSVDTGGYLRLRNSTAARCSAWRTRPPPTARGSSSGPTTARPTTGGGCATAATATSASSAPTAAGCSASPAPRPPRAPRSCSGTTTAPTTTSGGSCEVPRRHSHNAVEGLGVAIVVVGGARAR